MASIPVAKMFQLAYTSTYNMPLNFYVVPPDIMDRGTSTDQTVREGASISLTCAATGSPQPQINWRREHSKTIPLVNGSQGNATNSLTSVN